MIRDGPLPRRTFLFGIWRHPVLRAFILLSFIYFLILFRIWFYLDGYLSQGAFTHLAAVPLFPGSHKAVEFWLAVGNALEGPLLPLFPLLLGFIGDRFHTVYKMDDWASTAVRRAVRDIVLGTTCGGWIVTISAGFVLAAILSGSPLLVEWAFWWLFFKFVTLFLLGASLSRLLEGNLLLFSAIGFVLTHAVRGFFLEFWSPEAWLDHGDRWTLLFSVWSTPDIVGFPHIAFLIATFRWLLVFGVGCVGAVMLLRQTSLRIRAIWALVGSASVVTAVFAPSSPATGWTAVESDWFQGSEKDGADRYPRPKSFSEPAATLVEVYFKGGPLPISDEYTESLSGMWIREWEIAMGESSGHIEVSFRAAIAGGPDFLVFQLPACIGEPDLRVGSDNDKEIRDGYVLVASKDSDKEIAFSCRLYQTPFVPLSGILWNLRPGTEILFAQHDAQRYIGAGATGPRLRDNAFLLHPVLIPPFKFVRDPESNRGWQEAWFAQRARLFTSAKQSTFRWNLPADVWLVAQTWSARKEGGTSAPLLSWNLTRLESRQEFRPARYQYVSPYFSIVWGGMIGSKVLLISVGQADVVSHPSWIPPGKTATLKRVFEEIGRQLSLQNIVLKGTVFWGPENLFLGAGYPGYTLRPGDKWELEVLPGLCLRTLGKGQFDPPQQDLYRRYLCYSAFVCTEALPAEPAQEAFAPDSSQREDRARFLAFLKDHPADCSRSSVGAN
jgi:hypothetical protein